MDGCGASRAQENCMKTTTMLLFDAQEKEIHHKCEKVNLIEKVLVICLPLHFCLFGQSIKHTCACGILCEKLKM